MLGQHLNTRVRTRASQNLRSGSAGREHLVEERAARRRSHSRLARRRRARCREAAQFEPEGDMAKLDDLAPDRERRHQLRALQRCRLIRQRREPGVTCGPPNVGRRGPHRQTTQVAQGQRQQPSRTECRRQRRNQAKRQCRRASTGNDRQRCVVELQGIVVHLIRRCDAAPMLWRLSCPSIRSSSLQTF